jgi:hypothetical protein
MKKFIFCLLLCTSHISFGQTGVVLLTEEFTTSAPFTSKVHVTMPNGTSTTTTITPEANNVAQHDIDLNNIINGIIGQGYKIIPHPEGWTGGFMNTSNAMIFHRRMFFGAP